MIITYHNIDKRSTNYGTVDVIHFEKQIKSLMDKKFVSLKDYDPKNPNHVVIRFDDGYKGVINYALPILKKYNLPFEVFIVENFYKQAQNGNNEFLNKKDLIELVKNNGHLQYHSKTHCNLTEIKNTKKLIKEIIPPKELKEIDPDGFDFFAYPNWVYNDKILKIVRKYYKGALSGKCFSKDDCYTLSSLRMNNFKTQITEKPQKIALQFFGHLRSYKNTFEFLQKNLINILNNENYDVDIFIHTWNEMEHSTINYRWQTQDEIPKTIQVDDNIISDIKALYKPKAIKIDKQLNIGDEILTQFNGFPRSINACINPVYSMYEVSKLRQDYSSANNISYEWVIMTRCDILFKNIFSIDKILKCYEDYNVQLQNNELFYAGNPYGRNNEVEEYRFVTGSDLIYFARPDNIDKASLLYKDFNEYIKKFTNMEIWQMQWNIEQGLNPLPIKYFHGPDFDILRNDLQHKNKFKKKKNKYTIEKFLLSLFPYFLVQSKIKKIKKKLEDNNG